MTPSALVTYATNTQKLYATHMQMASNPTPRSFWLVHLKATVLPMYRAEFHERYEGMSLSELDEAADQLISYYSDHMQEAQT